MSSALRHVFALALVSVAVVLGGAPACSQQTEGERCDSGKAGDADCESGLSCVSSNSLLNGAGADRCCPEAGTETDKRCTRGTPSGSSSGGSSGSSSGGSSGSSSGGSSGSSSGGSSSEAEAGAAGAPVDASAGAGGAG